MGKNGGIRPGAGRPKGSLGKVTKLRRKTEEAMHTRIMKNVDILLNSQMALAKGCSMLYRVDTDERGKDQKAVLVTDAKEIKKFIDGDAKGDSFYYITTEKPENKAIDSMMDRAYGKATQRTELTGPEGKPIEIVNVEKVKAIEGALDNL